MAKLADARDLKSRGERSPCGFDPRLGHWRSGTSPGEQACDPTLLCAGRTCIPRLRPEWPVAPTARLMPASQPPITTLPTTRATALQVWLPWLCAPAFLLLPIGGCGLAAGLRRPALAAAPDSSPSRDVDTPALVPIRAVVSIVPPAG